MDHSWGRRMPPGWVRSSRSATLISRRRGNATRCRTTWNECRACQSCRGFPMDWEGSYRKGETPWDFGGPAPPLVALLEGRTVDHRGAGRVLVPGCGAGHDVVAWQEAGMEIVGLDLSPSALAAARERYGEGITGLEGDFFDEALAARCDVEMLFEHTFLCTIAPSLRWSYVEAATRWLVPGGG